MCGIIAVASQRDIAPILVEGLKRLEYRGYDSAGLAVFNNEQNLSRVRTRGKVQELEQTLAQTAILGHVGLAHTRWATHGEPSEHNAHPHVFEESLALVHNGIIENFSELKKSLLEKGYEFTSDTDTEVIAYCLGDAQKKSGSLLDAVKQTVGRLEGAYALAVMSKENPNQIIATRKGSPLVLGIGIGENYISSDVLALVPFTQEIIVLEEGDVAIVSQNSYEIFDESGATVKRDSKKITLTAQSVTKGSYKHFMKKEIFEQPQAVCAAMEGRFANSDIQDAIFGANASEIFDRAKNIQIVACGTSYHAGLVAKHWIENIAGIPCQVDIASELRYQREVVPAGTLFVALSQSGETADTLAALRGISSKNYCGTLSICNVPESALVRESKCTLLTHAGPEIGVASTKAFTTQLVALLMLTHCLGKRNDKAKTVEAQIVAHLRKLPALIEKAIQLDGVIERYSEFFEEKDHTLFIGRGCNYAIAKEGALKLKEISYIHAEAYPAGELKHGPLALVDKHMPVVVVASNDKMLEKLKSNIHEVLARNGEVILVGESGMNLDLDPNTTVLEVPNGGPLLAPILLTIPLQLLAYHVALRKGTDVDQPRNLAKSVTVE